MVSEGIQLQLQLQAGEVRVILSPHLRCLRSLQGQPMGVW